MNLFFRRHLALFCAIFAAASLCGCFLASYPQMIITAICLSLSMLLIGILLLCKARRAQMFKALLCLLFGALAFIQSYYAFDLQEKKIGPFIGTPQSATIHILSRGTSSDFFSSFEVLATVKDVEFKAILECEYKSVLNVGDIVTGTVEIHDIEDVYENSSYYLSDGIFAVVSSSEDTLVEIGHQTSKISRGITAINKRFSEIIESTVKGQAADMASAMFLGNRDLLDKEIIRDFRRIGLSHVLALSGMHLSIIMMLSELFLKHLAVKKRRRYIIILTLSFFYLIITGFSLSAIRAFIMMTFVCAAFLLTTENDPLTALFFSLFLIFVIFPHAVQDVGIWMSFLAVLGIFVMEHFKNELSKKLYESRLHKKWIKILLPLFTAIIISLAANIFVCIPLWISFGEISLLSLPANLLLAPLASVLLSLIPLLIVFYHIPLLSLAAPYIGIAIRWLADILIDVSSFFSHLRITTISLNYNFVPFILIPAGIVFAILLIVPLKQKRWILSVPLASVLLFSSLLTVHNYMYKDVITVDYASYGESEMLVATSNSSSVIFDLSTGANSYLFEATEISSSRYRTEIDALILTHYHTLHISTFSKNAARSMIRHLYIPEPSNEDEYHIMNSLIENAKKKNVAVTVYKRGQSFSPIKNLTVDISPIAYIGRSTHPTLSLSLSTSQTHLVYMGESAHESRELLDYIDPKTKNADIIILGTHGPITKTDFSYQSEKDDPYFIINDQTVFSHFKNAQPDSRLILNTKQVTLSLLCGETVKK